MKEANISSCVSQVSTTTIIHNTKTSSSSSSSSSTSMELKLPSSASSSSSSSMSQSPPSSLPVTAARLLDACVFDGGGSRAIDRHNPIVTDGKRSLHISNSITSTPISSPYQTAASFKNSPISSSPPTQLKKPKKTKLKIKVPTTSNKEGSKKELISHHEFDEQQTLKISASEQVKKKGSPGVKPWLQDYVSQPIATESARYLLAGNDDNDALEHTDAEGDDAGAVNFFEELLRFDRVLKLDDDSPSSELDEITNYNSKHDDDDNHRKDQLVPMPAATTYSPSLSSSSSNSGSNKEAVEEEADDQSYTKSATTTPNHSKSLAPAAAAAASNSPDQTLQGKISSSAASSPLDYQVVVLRVSLHCRGCEGKVRKHISRMKGVRSFNIDFAAKKVTVVGDVTPLGVLATISKVKTAKLLTPPLSSSTAAATAEEEWR